MKRKPKDVIENFVIAVLQIKLMFNNLPHNVRVRQVNYVNSDISTALLLVSNTTKLKANMLQCMKPCFVVTGVPWHAVIDAF